MLDLDQLPPVEKPQYTKHLGPVDVAQLTQVVGKVSEEVWQRENAQKENNFSCFHHTAHIVFRFIEGMRDHRVSYARKVWPVWQGMIQPIMDAAIKPYGFVKPEFPKVMLARLTAGYDISMHRDGAGSNLYTHKIHVPLQTNPGAIFMIGDERFHLEAGHAYEVNNLTDHGVENTGDQDRVHLIFEVFDAAT